VTHGRGGLPPGWQAEGNPPGRPKRLFVLDTNVLMHDPLCLFRFENTTSSCDDHLEELDSHKRA